jgi:hypothetical protein
MELFRLPTLLIAALSVSPCFADEFVAVGRLEQVVLLPEGTDRCPAACPADNTGKTVCISNSCGCGEAVVRIDRVLLGTNRPMSVVKYRLGEWCETEFSLVNPLVLLRISDDHSPQWSALLALENSSDLGFETSSFTFIGNVDVRKLQATDGIASLSELERALVSNNSFKVTPDGAPQLNR